MDNNCGSAIVVGQERGGCRSLGKGGRRNILHICKGIYVLKIVIVAFPVTFDGNTDGAL